MMYGVAGPSGGVGELFTCPRCGRETASLFYGPCLDCREELRMIAANDGRNAQLTLAENQAKEAAQAAEEEAERQRHAERLRQQFADKPRTKRAS